jgi:hypothetical protein
MTKVVYKFPIEVFYQNEAIRAAADMMKGFNTPNPFQNIGLKGDIGDITINWDSEDGKGMTPEQNEIVVKELQKALDDNPKEGITYTVKTGVRQDES